MQDERKYGTLGGTATEERCRTLPPVDTALLLCGACTGGCLAIASPRCAIATLLIALAVLAGRIRVTVWCGIAACFALGWGRATIAVASFEQQRIAIRNELQPPLRCALSGRVHQSPRSQGDSSSATLVWQAVLDEVDCEGRNLPTPLLARLYGGPEGLARGDTFRAVADLGALRLFRNFHLSNPTLGAARRESVASGSLLTLQVVHRAHGVAAIIDLARHRVRQRIEATFFGPSQAMAKALVLGDNNFSQAQSTSFQHSGLAHLLAVSGSHLVVAVLSMVAVLNSVLRRVYGLAAHCDVGRVTAWVGAALALVYADFAGGSGSAWRAAAMLCVVLGARALGRWTSPQRVIALSVGASWVVDPLVAYDLSFVLSLAATAGLCAFGSMATDPAARTGGWPVLRAVEKAGTTTLAATLPCLPVILMISPGVSAAGLAGNLLAGPLGEVVALPLCLLHAVMWLWPAAESGIAWVASGALSLVLELSNACANSRWLYFRCPAPSGWHISAATIALLGYETNRRHPRGIPRQGLTLGAALAFASLVISLQTRRARDNSPGAPRRPLLRVTALDVGQGDSTWIQLPDGRTVVVDGGGFVGSPVDPGRRVLVPTARALGVDTIDTVVLTHPHPDHFGGLLALVQQHSVGEFWLSGQGLTDPPGPQFARLLSELHSKQVPVFTAQQLCSRQRLRAGTAQADPYLKVLSPCPHFEPEQSANDNSLVLKVQLGKRAALLAGDAEQWAEQQLLATQPSILHADYLKVGHHGSRTSSSSEWLAAVSPTIASISCGVRNRFGHPHPDTVANLRSAGILAARLDHSGAVEWTTDGTTQWVRTFQTAQQTPW